MSRKLVCNPPPPRPNIVRISQCAPLPPAFAVDQILPICSLSAILATPGAGKTTLATMLAAATHPPYDLTCDHPTVLMVSPFADAQLEIRPRLAQLGTNLDRVRVMDHLYLPDARSNPRRAYTIHDLSIIDAELSEYRSYKLLIIDCAEMFLDLPSRPSRKRILEQLYQLIDLANSREIAVVLMLTASQLRENPFTSTLLSAVAEASRTSWILDKDAAGQRTLYPHKNVLDFLAMNYLIADLPNLAHTTPPGTCAPSPETPPLHQSQIENRNSQILPEDQVVLRNRALFQPDPNQLPFASRRAREKERQKPGPQPYARDFACEVLLDALKKGPKPVGDKDDPRPRTLMYDLKLANITFGTAMRAKRHLNIEAYKKGKQWFWRVIPMEEARTTPPASCASSCETVQSHIENRQSEIPTATPPASCAPSPKPLDNPSGWHALGYSREHGPIAPELRKPETAPSDTDPESHISDSQPGQSETQSPTLLLLSAKSA